MPIYKMSDKQYKVIRDSGKHSGKHIDVIAECNTRMCWPLVNQRQVLLEHNNKTKFVCVLPQMRFITQVVTK